MQRDSNIIRRLYSQQLIQKIKTIKILVIGAGGIGCELLKQVVKYPFQQIHIVDLDTIEISNLNRQFIYRSSHRNQSKAHTAKQILQQQYQLTDQQIFSYQLKIQDFDIEFFKQFGVIFGCLDNIEARKYINKVCILEDIVLVDSGTMGFNGQATLIKKNRTMCYECINKSDNQKQYPVCTIRRQPSKPIHCVVYSKLLFEVIFGEVDNELMDLKEEYQSILLQGYQAGQQVDDHDQQIRTNVLKYLGHIYGPDPIDVDGYLQSDQQDHSAINHEQQKQRKKYNAIDLLLIQRDCLVRLLKIKVQQKVVEFEKDDDLIIKYLMSCTNLRAIQHKIELINEFQTKEMAGNIVPAIASTNSIAAAVQVDIAIKYLNDQQNQIKDVFCQNQQKKVHFQIAESPRKECLICGEDYQPSILRVNFKEYLLGNIVKKYDEYEEILIQMGTDIVYEKMVDMEDDEVEVAEKQMAKNVEQVIGDHKIIRLEIEVMQDDGTRFTQFIVLINMLSYKGQQETFTNNYLHSKGIVHQQVQDQDQQQVQEQEQGLLQQNGVANNVQIDSKNLKQLQIDESEVLVDSGDDLIVDGDDDLIVDSGDDLIVDGDDDLIVDGDDKNILIQGNQSNQGWKRKQQIEEEFSQQKRVKQVMID